MEYRRVAVIYAYAPAENENEATKDIFYERLERTYDALQSYYTKVIVGDLNSQVGRVEVYKQTVGRHNLLHESSNDNGVRLINFAIW